MQRLIELMKGIEYKEKPIRHIFCKQLDDSCELIISIDSWSKARTFTKAMMDDAPDKFFLEEIRYMVLFCVEAEVRREFKFHGETI